MADNPGLLTNLPAPVSSFIGREAELAEVRRLVAGSRLVTLTGAGGAGKTRLGLQVAAGLLDGTGDGVWFADLAPLRDPDLVAVTVADALGVRQQPGRPVLDTVVEAVGQGRLLVLLDNCEHVIGACAKLADALLRGCPNLALLATSREPQGIGGERVYRVPSMRTPADGDDAAAIRASEAVRVLEDRAAAQGVPLAWDEAAAEVAGRICRRLDGIPQFDHAGTGSAWYRLLETVRQYAAGQLDTLGPAVVEAARIAHRDYYLALAEAAAPQLVAADQAAWLDRLDAELGNLRAAIAFSQAQGDPEPGLRLARRLGELHLTGRLLAARAYATHAEGDPAGSARDNVEALRLFRPAGDRLQVGTILSNLSDYELGTGDPEAARRHLAESLDIARAVNDRHGIIIQTFNFGLAEYLGGSPDAAEAWFAESLDLARRMGMKRSIAYALIGLALVGRGGADPGWSARLHGAADQTLADLGHVLQPLEARLAGLDRQRLRAAMGAEVFDAQYAAGRTLDLAQELAPLGRTDAAAGQPRGAVSGEAMTVLTPRELDVLKLVAQGLSNPEIARRLVLSEHTVHRHVANILRKLNLSSRSAAAAWGVRTGLV